MNKLYSGKSVYGHPTITVTLAQSEIIFHSISCTKNMMLVPEIRPSAPHPGTNFYQSKPCNRRHCQYNYHYFRVAITPIYYLIINHKCFTFFTNKYNNIRTIKRKCKSVVYFSCQYFKISSGHSSYFSQSDRA